MAASRTTCPAFLLSMCLYVHSRATVIVFADMCCIRVLPLGCYGLYVRCGGFGVQGSLSAVMHAPFHASMLRPAS